jgi:hypothetical protein
LGDRRSNRKGPSVEGAFSCPPDRTQLGCKKRERSCQRKYGTGCLWISMRETPESGRAAADTRQSDFEAASIRAAFFILATWIKRARIPKAYRRDLPPLVLQGLFGSARQRGQRRVSGEIGMMGTGLWHRAAHIVRHGQSRLAQSVRAPPGERRFAKGFFNRAYQFGASMELQYISIQPSAHSFMDYV